MWSIFCAIKRSWSQHFVEQFSAFIILLMTYSALLFIALSLTNIQNLFEMWGQVSQISIYINPASTPEEQSILIDSLADEPMLESFRLVTAEESAQKFEQKFSHVTSQKVNAQQVAKYFPSYLIADLNQTLAYKSGFGSLDRFAEDIKGKFPWISNVSYGKSWLHRYINILSTVKVVGWFLIMAFLVASVIISSSIVKTILYSRRDEIEILEFIGADDSEIYVPQVVNSVLIATVAFSISLLVIYGVYTNFFVGTEDLLGGQVVESLSFISPFLSLVLFMTASVSVFLYSTFTIYNLLPRRKKALLLPGAMD